MKSIVINGGKPLFGNIRVSGSKNAALPILFATILTNGVSKIENLPDIGDVRCALDILRGLGATVTRVGTITYIDTASLSYSAPSRDAVCKIRASTYLIGACLSRFGECELLGFGGCNFSERPIDMHISAAEALGAVLRGDRLTANRLRGGKIVFEKPSVGATVNAILLAACADGETVIRGFAREPHIDSLVEFLRSAGAEIIRAPGEIIIKGKKLHGGSISIPGDMIEAGTYLALGVVTGGEITVSGCPISHLCSPIDAFLSFGAQIRISDDGISACKSDRMRYAEITADPYPGFPTDLQPIFSTLGARFSGGVIIDNVWSSRFGYLSELSHFGLKYDVKDNSAKIEPSRIHCANASAPDLRGGMACIMSALVAEGESVIGSAEIVERGYEDLEDKLRSVGATVSDRFLTNSN